MPTIQALWARIEAWLAQAAPEHLRHLHPGAAEEEIRQAERLMRVKFPREIRASYRLHNGGDDNFIEFLWLLPLNWMVSNWQTMKEVRADLLERDEDYTEYEADLMAQWRLVQKLRARPPLAGEEDDTELTEPPSYMYPGWWHPKWVPLADDGCGNMLCLDLAPGPAGWDGQIVYFDHEYGRAHVVASSWPIYLAAIADDLEAGKYTYSEGRLEPVDEQTMLRRWRQVE